MLQALAEGYTAVIPKDVPLGGSHKREKVGCVPGPDRRHKVGFRPTNFCPGRRKRCFPWPIRTIATT